MKDRLWRSVRFFQTRPLVRTLASLKLAVATMAALGAILAVGTVVESRYDAAMARLCVYDQWWFQLVLALLFANILLSVFVRLPLSRRQYPFACIHLGMLLLLSGAALTRHFGLDGTMEIPEATASRALLLPQTVVRTYADEHLVAERPFHRTLRHRLGDLGAVPGMDPTAPRIVEFLPFSRTVRRVVADSHGAPMVQLSLRGASADTSHLVLALGSRLAPSRANAGPLALSLEIVASPSAFRDTSASLPAHFEVSVRVGEDSLHLSLSDLRSVGRAFKVGGVDVQVQQFLPDAKIGPWGLENRSGSLANPAVRLHVRDQDSSWDEILYGKAPGFRFSGNRHPQVAWSVEFRPAGTASRTPLLRLGISGDSLLARLEKDGRVLSSFPVHRGRETKLPPAGPSLVLEAVERKATLRDSCLAVDPAPGRELPPSAIRVDAGPWGPPSWIPLGGAVFWNDRGTRRAVSFEHRRVALPFGIRLDRFRMGLDPGTMQASSYESFVHVVDSFGNPLDSGRIAMNEPLRRQGLVFCQSGFSADPGGIPTTYLSVDRDPGRWLKYFGSLVAILSIVWYFFERNRQDRKDQDA